MDALAADAGTTPGTTPAAPRRAARTRSAPRPVPTVSEDYDHLALDGLRAYRTALQHEESQVSYWRRILQARLDVVREGRAQGGTRALDASALRPVLTDRRVTSMRNALVEVMPVDDIPPLPNLGELWERRVDPTDTDGLVELEQDLSIAERQLSDYRAALHLRLGGVTGELIARYRQQPALCLSALPLPAPSRRPDGWPRHEEGRTGTWVR